MLFGFLAAMATVVGSMVIPVVIMLILPGRKGDMRTVREAAHPLEPEAAWKLYADRLAFDGFAVEPSGRPWTLVATRRPPPPRGDEERIVTHASKPMTVEVTFRQVPGGVHATVAGRLNDFVVYDSGEGRQVDLTLHRLMTADLDSDPPPAVPGVGFSAILAAAAGAIALAGPLLSRLAAADSRWRSVGAMVGFAVGAMFALSMASQARREIGKRPDELRGAWLAHLATVLALAALAAAAVSVARRMGWVRAII